MLTDYIAAAMRKAKYEILEDGTYFGSIPDFEGVCANRATLEECRDELMSVLEGWILLSVRKNLPMPVVEGLDLNVAASEAA